MSKPRRSFLFFLLAGLVLLHGFQSGRAQSVEVRIKLRGSEAFVEGRLIDAGSLPSARNFSFLTSHVGAENLADRFNELNLIGKDGQKLEYKKLSSGEFLSAAEFQSWNYKAALTPPKNFSAMAHISWLAAEQGILMLDDLLPQFGGKISAKVTIDVPADWKIATTEKSLGGSAFETADLQKAVFFVGRNWREREFQAAGARVTLLISGEWRFSDAEAFEMTSAILAEYEKLFGGNTFANSLVFLGRFPQEAKFGRWEAETRGATVTIYSADMPFSTQSAQKLHEQLRHELFHLWMPNSLNLSGNYDWFYEGFALYQSLRTAVAMNRIRFDDFLDTLGRAYDLDSMMTQRTSLLEASKNRWSGANTQVYARGMLVAFLADLALLQKSRGKFEISDLLREIYRTHRFPAQRTDAAEAILKILEARAELVPIVERYVKGRENISWQTELEAAGIETRTENFSTKLTVKAKPGGRQKDLLDKLGYNNWRLRPGLSR